MRSIFGGARNQEQGRNAHVERFMVGGVSDLNGSTFFFPLKIENRLMSLEQGRKKNSREFKDTEETLK